MPALAPSQIVPLHEKLGYAAGEAAATGLLLALGAFQSGLGSGSFGLTASGAANLLLVVHALAAVCAVVMGLIADRTWSRWGRYRGWLLWSAAPLVLTGILAVEPALSGPAGSLGPTLVTWFLVTLAFTAGYLPYTALGGVMTSDRAERTGLSAFRFVFALLAVGAWEILQTPLVAALGHGNEVRGRQAAVGIFALLAAAIFPLTFLAARERIRPPTANPTLRVDFSDLRKNRPWLFLCWVILFFAAALSWRSDATLVYFATCLQRPDLLPAYNLCGLAAAIAGILLSKPLVQRFGRRTSLMICLLLSAGLMTSLLFVPAAAVVAAFVLQALTGLAVGPALPLLWSMMADVADYSEWRNYRRATGLIFSGTVIGLQAGLVLGGALGCRLLSWYGYVDSSPPSTQAGWGVRLGASVFPAITLLFGAACLVFYPLGNALTDEMEGQLAGQRYPSGIRVR